MSNRGHRSISRAMNIGVATATTTFTVMCEPFNIKEFENFCIFARQHSGTITAGIQDLAIQVANTSQMPSATDSQGWINLPTTTLAIASALGAGCATLTARFDNCFSWLRLRGRADTSTTAVIATFTIGGMTTLMATVTRAYSEVDDQIAEASSVNREIGDLYSSINTLNSENLNSQAIGLDETDHSIKFFNEVFS